MKKKLLNIKILDYNNFTPDLFANFIMENFTINTNYTILTKIGYEGNSIYLMCGTQISFQILEHHNLEMYANIYNVINLRILELLEDYDLETPPNSIIIYYKSLSPLLRISNPIPNIKEYSLKKSEFKKIELKKVFSLNYLPLSLNNKNFGHLLEGSLKSQYINTLIKNISIRTGELPIILDFNILNISNLFLKNIHLNKNKIKILILDISIKDLILLKNQSINDYIIGLFNINTKDFIKLEGYIRIVYDLNSGITFCNALDIKQTSERFERIINNYKLLVEKDTLIELSRLLQLDYIKPPRFKLNTMSNNRIGVLDVETFTNSLGLGQVYCLGYGTLDNMDNIKTFYVTESVTNLNSDLLIIQCINSMLDPKYHNYYWYIHNMGKFDIIYLYKTLSEYNLYSKENFYNLNATYKDGKMLKLVIKRKIKNKFIKIILLDSYNLLSNSLERLCKDFEVTTQKGFFPYSFVTEKTLDYKGLTPDIKYYNNISTEVYKTISTNAEWSLKEESLKYLKKDILGLLEVLEKFKKNLFLEHNLELTEGLTISRLALNKFLNHYLNDSKIPLINKLKQFNFIYAGYFGGRTEVFKPYGENLYYYDVNSLYPTVALNHMPGLNCYYIKSFNDKGSNLDNLFGVFKARIKSTNDYLGLLPVKTELGLTFPNGEFEGIWLTPELEFAKKQGYEVKILEGYNFDSIPSYFKNYILELFELKSKTTGSKKAVNKSLLNNLLGRFGLNIIKPVNKIVNEKELDFLLRTRKIISFHEINSNSILVNYNPIIDQDICIQNGLDYNKVLLESENFKIDKKINKFQDVSLIVSALVTSYARVFMLKIILDFFKDGGVIYYMDTDSIVTNKPIQPYLIGKNLGQFKLEYEIKEGYFISNKTYCLVLHDGTTIIKCKGVINNSLTLDDFKEMYFSSKDVKGIKTNSIVNLSKGSVIIENKNILIQHDAYKKRTKIFNNKGLWVETKPIIYNNIVKNIIPFNN